jgi:hypothetical protein
MERKRVRPTGVGHEDLARVIRILGDTATVLSVDEDLAVVAWLKQHFAFPGPGSTCEWTRVPQARTASLYYRQIAAAKAVMHEMLSHVKAQDEEVIEVIWHSSYVTGLRMSVRVFRRAFEWLLQVDEEEMHIVSQQGGWYIECDPFFSEIHGARLRKVIN